MFFDFQSAIVVKAARRVVRQGVLSACALLGLASSFFVGSLAHAQILPDIKLHDRNRVPACVTPERLMSFLRSRNPRLDDRFAGIARHYKEHGEANRIRWDYAFFQMILETNYLLFKNGAGQGDVNPRQNNFAGIGTTGGGVPGDAFPDVSTGVLAQIQHLTAYAGDRVANPVGRRTRERQDDIIQRSKMLGRPVTFRDLTRRWAVDRRYGASIEFVAGRFRATYCNGSPPDLEAAAPGKIVASNEASTNANWQNGRGMNRSERLARGPYGGGAGPETSGAEIAKNAVANGRAQAVQGASALGVPPSLVAPPKLVQRPRICKVFTASYGGDRNVLIRAVVDSEFHYTALQVARGEEDRLAETFIRTHARGGEALSQFASRDAALARAFELCPAAQHAAN